MKNLERLALVGALAAAVFVEGSLNARVKDLAQQRDIYQKPLRQLGAGRPQLADRGERSGGASRRSQSRPGSGAGWPRRA